MMVKRIISLLFFLVLLSALGWLLRETLRPEVLPLGSELPELEYLTQNGKNYLKPDSGQVMLVMLFHPDCEHCEYQLNRFNDQSEKLDSMSLVLLTTDQKIFVNDKIKTWPVLSQLNNVGWGIVERNHFKDLFGSFAYPSSYIFNQSGILSHKIRGEVKIEKLLSIINDFGGRERQISGIN